MTDGISLKVRSVTSVRVAAARNVVMDLRLPHYDHDGAARARGYATTNSEASANRRAPRLEPAAVDRLVLLALVRVESLPHYLPGSGYWVGGVSRRYLEREPPGWPSTEGPRTVRIGDAMIAVAARAMASDAVAPDLVDDLFSAVKLTIEALRFQQRPPERVQELALLALARGLAANRAAPLASPPGKLSSLFA